MTESRPSADSPNPGAPSAQAPAADAATPERGAPAGGGARAGQASGRVAGRRPLAWSSYAWIVGAALVVVLSLHFLGPVLTPFLVGAILAYLGTPLVGWAAQRGIARALSTVVVVVLFGLLLLALFFVLVPLVQAEVGLAAKKLPELIAAANARVAPWLQEHLDITLGLDLEMVKTWVTQNMHEARALSMRLLSGVTAGGLFVVSLLVNLALIPVVMFYLLRDWNMIIERLDTLIPRGWQVKVRTILEEIDAVLAEFLRGQLLVMLVLAGYYAIGLSIAGLDRAVAIGILTGLLVFIPYVGFGLGLVLGIVAALLQWGGWPAFLGVLSVYAIGQLLEAYVLLPWLVGDRIGLHPLAVIFALLAFGQLFGFAGVLMALPVSAAILVGLRHLLGAYVESPVYRDRR